jgi:hypothetical protein
MWVALGCGDPIRVEAFEPIDCSVVPRSSQCRFDVWPNSVSSKNSDRWLAANHDDLREIRPKVLVLNFHNESRGDAIRPAIEARILALAEGSRYRGYQDANAPAFVNYEVAGIVDYTDEDPDSSPDEASTLVPEGPDGLFDVHQLFEPPFLFPHPSGSEEQVGLCTLFEIGAVNEVWLASAGPRQPPLMLERKQRYDTALTALPGDFNTCIHEGDEYCLQMECGVTVRLAHLNPTRGSGCDLQVRGWSIVDTGLSIPYFAENATAFLNADFRERYSVDFDSFADVCVRDQEQACVSYPFTGVAEPVMAEGGDWRFDPYRQGCGRPEFPPNADGYYDWTSAVPVISRCEHYGLGDGDSGDAYEIYEASKLSIYDELLPDDPRFPNDCGRGWQLYWRQSMPGLDNPAFGADGQRMKNWWPFMFY